MTTMRELHQKAGNPELSHWKDTKLFTVTEAALLTAGLEPLEYDNLVDYEVRDKLRNEKPVNWQYAFMLLRSLVDAICTQELKSPLILVTKSNYNHDTWEETREQAAISIDDANAIVCNQTRIHRNELHKWLKNNGYFEAPQQITINANINMHQQTEPTSHNKVLLLPEPTYTTPLLDIVDAVIERFWSGYSPNKNMVAKKQIEIEEWIQKKYPDISNPYMAKAIDRICRHPNAKAGGNKKIL